jgi:hypothetical protein
VTLLLSWLFVTAIPRPCMFPAGGFHGCFGDDGRDVSSTALGARSTAVPLAPTRQICPDQHVPPIIIHVVKSGRQRKAQGYGAGSWREVLGRGGFSLLRRYWAARLVTRLEDSPDCVGPLPRLIALEGYRGTVRVLSVKIYVPTELHSWMGPMTGKAALEGDARPEARGAVRPGCAGEPLRTSGRVTGPFARLGPHSQ